MSEKHTELPWSVGANGRSVVKGVPGLADGHDHYMIAVASSHSLLAPSETKANAELIVRSVNALPDLVMALEEIESFCTGGDAAEKHIHSIVCAALAKVKP
jgi:hypothetical protein